MDLSSIPPSPRKGIVNIVVEIPAGSRNKYEYCSDAGIMALLEDSAAETNKILKRAGILSE